MSEEPINEALTPKDILYLIGFTLFIICLFGGELVILIWLTKHGYLDKLLGLIP